MFQQILRWLEFYIDTNIIETYSLLPKIIGEEVGTKQIFSLPVQTRKLFKGVPKHSVNSGHSCRYSRSGIFLGKVETEIVVHRNPFYGTNLYDVDQVRTAIMNDENRIDAQASIESILNSTII